MAGYATPAWSNDQSPAIDDAALLDIGHGIEIAEHPYGVCSTAAATAAKEVTIDYSGTLTLFTGLTIRVKFTNDNTAANPTLNVNSTGAIPIMRFGTTTVQGNSTDRAWNAGIVVTFVYDGTNWIMDSIPETVGLMTDGIPLSGADDLDNIQNTGWYYWSGSPFPANVPTNSSSCGLIVDRCGTTIRQTVHRGGSGSTPLLYIRYKLGAYAWTPWVAQVTEMLAADLSLHVNAVSGNDSNDGLSAATALKTIAAALNKIPADQGGHYAQIVLADGTYSALSISNRNISLLMFAKESGATDANIKIQGGTVTDNGNACIIFSHVTFTSKLTLYGHNRLSQFIVSSVLFDGGGVEGRGPYCRLNDCTFRNISTGSAITIANGYASIYAAHIENTCTTGITASEAVAIVSTYSLQNNATTPYETSYSGRIFVGGRTYLEASSKVSLFNTQTAIGTGTKDITISENYRSYPFLEFIFSRGNTTSRGIVTLFSQSVGTTAYFPVSVGGVLASIRISNVSGTQTQIRFSNASISDLYINSVNGISY